MLQPDELDRGTRRRLAQIADDADQGYDAVQVRARAAQIVDNHAVRLGLDPFAAAAIIGCIEAIPVRANG